MRTGGAAALAAVVLGLTGCSGDAGGGNSSDTTSASKTASTSTTSTASRSTSTTAKTTTATSSTSASTSSGSTTTSTPPSAPSSTTTRSTRTFGPTTEPGPRPPTGARPQDCTFPTALGSTPGKTFTGVTCKAAQEVWRRYLALPPDPAAGNSNHRELEDGWVCYAPTAASAVTYDEGGICERKAQQQKFVLHFRRR